MSSVDCIGSFVGRQAGVGAGAAVGYVGGTSEHHHQIQNDAIVYHDGPSATIVMIHLNIAVSSIGRYAADRPKLQALCKGMMDCKTMLVALCTSLF